MAKEIVKKSDGTVQRTLGNIMECEKEYIVYDGSDYIGFNKEEYEVKDAKEGKGRLW